MAYPSSQPSVYPGAAAPGSSWRGPVDALQTFAPPLGRTLLSLIFLLSGAMKVLNWGGTAGHMEGEGMPAALVPLLLAMAILVELGGGLSVLLGCYARLGALALVLFLVPTTLIFHDFWTYEGAAQQSQMQHFLKNLAVMGGLLMVVGLGPGPLSVDWWRSRAAGRV